MNKQEAVPETLLGAEYLNFMSELIASTAQESRFQGSPAYIHWPYIGSGYCRAQRRLLYVGRASYKGHESMQLRPDGNSERGRREYLRDRIADREPWNGGPGGCETFFTTDRTGKMIIKNRYFWKLLRTACAALGVTASESEDPFPAIAWSNLFKIAPLGAGNPPKWMQALELAEGRAGKLLQMEINQLDPDVVVFVTGHAWMHEFWWRDSPNRLPNVEWEPDADNWLEKPIHRVGHQSRMSGDPRLLVATARPELRTRNVALARQVSPALKELLQGWVVSRTIR